VSSFLILKLNSDVKLDILYTVRNLLTGTEEVAREEILSPQ
jgi:hypothetical protein